MRVSTILALFTSIAVTSATPFPDPDAALVARSNGTVAEITKRSGCGSVGPLGTGHYQWYIDVPCTVGDSLFCEATDASGCGQPNHGKIGSMVVYDSSGTFQLAKSAANMPRVAFVCPSFAKIRCEVNFVDNDDGPNYSLRGMCIHCNTPAIYHTQFCRIVIHG
ncbi:hypothetical protein C8Q79DRAFT_920845 [Trametes meyenii]|nr:hypothetical protein C8Q79DRAFT_920845 [Trametes meyenii]